MHEKLAHQDPGLTVCVSAANNTDNDAANLIFSACLVCILQEAYENLGDKTFRRQ